MKNNKKNIGQNKTNINSEIVYPGTYFDKDQKAILEDFKIVRKAISNKQRPKDILLTQLLQLKFFIEDYIHNYNGDQQAVLNTQETLFFGGFLKEYIQRIEKKNKEFAEEIDVKATELSLIINKRRKPTDKIIYRLEIHSNNLFPAKLWFRVLEKDREIELMRNRDIIERERKHVRKTLAVSY